MSTEQNKTMIRQGFEAGLNHGNLTVFEEILAPTYVNHNMPMPEPGPAGFRAVVGAFLSAFSGFQVTLEAVIAEGDKVSTRGYFTGTHTGAFMGIPATGKPVHITYCDMWRIENGKAVENWVQMDMLGMMQQLGVIPTP